MENEPISISHFPPGFRFHPSDEELIVHYLLKKLGSRPLPAQVVAEIDLYSYNPWELPKNALFGEDEWSFFTPRDRKFPKGERPNRTASSGFCKATWTDKPILSASGSRRIGVKKTLVFYIGRPPKGLKTDWIMNEYKLSNKMTRPSRSKGSMRVTVCHDVFFMIKCFLVERSRKYALRLENNLCWVETLINHQKKALLYQNKLNQLKNIKFVSNPCYLECNM